MFNPVYTNKFRKDLRKMQRSNRDMNKFKEVSSKLIVGSKLEKRYKDHKLLGVFIRIDGNATLSRTGCSSIRLRERILFLNDWVLILICSNEIELIKTK